MEISIDDYLEKEEQLKTALKKILEKMKLDKEKGIISEEKDYGFGRFYEGAISVTSIQAQAGNHLFDDCPELFEIAEHDGHLVREYFQNVPLTQAINDLYKTFPELLEGEPKRFQGYFDLSKISKNVPLLD